MEKGMKRKAVKERGRPTKTKRLEEEALTADNTNPSSPETDPTLLDKSMASKPRTRYALAVSDKKATPSSQSRITVQNMDKHASETLMLVQQILFDPDRVDKANYVQVEAKDTHSDLESMSPGKIIEAQQGMTSPSNIMNQTPQPELGKLTSDLPAQTPQPELPLQLQVASPSHKTMANYDPPEIEANAVSNTSPNLTVQTSDNPAINEVMSKPEDPLIELEGYKVKKEVAPLLKDIFKKYGDIARKCVFSIESRPYLLEMVCSIYKRLEASDFKQLTPWELNSMKAQIKDLELVRVNITWLHKRLYQISQAVDKDFKGKGAILIDEKKRAVKNCEEELKMLEARLQQEKEELDAFQICSGSLVHGLV